MHSFLKLILLVSSLSDDNISIISTGSVTSKQDVSSSSDSLSTVADFE